MRVDSAVEVVDLQADAEWVRQVDTIAAEVGVEVAGFCTVSAYQVPASAGRAALAGPGVHESLFHCWGVQDGVPSSIVTHLDFDIHGRLWAAPHEGGLCRFDGETFTSFTVADGLPHNQVRNILCSPHGDIWLSTEMGVCRFDGTAFHSFDEVDGVGSGPLLLSTHGELWHARQGVSRFDGTSFVALPGAPPGADITALAEGDDGEIWMGTQSGGLWRWDGQALTCRATPGEMSVGAVLRLFCDRQKRVWCSGGTDTACLADDGLRRAADIVGLPGEYRAVGQDGSGNIWLSGTDGLIALSPSDVTVVARHSLVIAPDSQLTDKQGRLWVADPGGAGVARISVSQARLYNTQDGVGHNRVQSVAEDQDGRVWIGSWGGGINRFDGDHFTRFTTDNGLSSNEVESACLDHDGRIWFATRSGGACCWDGDRFDQPAAVRDLGVDFLWCVRCDSDGRLWFGTNGGGACCWDGERVTTWTTADGLPDDRVWDIFQDRRGRMWFATMGSGIACYDGEVMVGYTTADGLPNDPVWSVTEDDDGNLWFGTFSGLCRFDGSTFHTLTTADGLAHDNVWCGHRARDGRLWFGTWGGGVSVWDPATRAFTNRTVADGLADNNVRAISEDADGRLWLCTYGGGVSLYDGQVFQTLSRKDGLIHDAVQDVCFDGEGSAWIATENGITRYRPDSLPPRVRLESVIADQTYSEPSQVTIPDSQRFVIAEMRGSSASTSAGRLAFEYRLAPQPWQVTRATRIELVNLSVGPHVLEVRAVDRDLRRSTPARLEIDVVADSRQDRMEALQAQLSEPAALEQFIGSSPSLQAVLDQVNTVADTDVTVLVLGETGTGKGLAAHAIHAMSGRRDGPFLQVNCGAIPAGLVESELFGHEKGAFTGAVHRKIGRFELADGGTLFLDEIGDLPLDAQRVLLHVLQDGSFHRVGGRETLRANVRVLAATNRDLTEAMRQGVFREDLYFRISPFVVRLPPLRDRHEDIPLLVEHFVERFARHLHRDIPIVDADAMTYLRGYHWPGNVRELQHVVQRALLVSRAGVVDLGDLFHGEAPTPRQPDSSAPPAPGSLSLDEHREQVDDAHRQYIARVLEQTDWVIYGEHGAARLLGTHPEKLRVRMRSLGLKKPS